MSPDAILREALTPIVPTVVPHVYRGEDLEYITYNYSTLPALDADSAPRAAIHLLQIHWYLPAAPEGSVNNVNPNAKKLLISAALAGVFGTWPEIVDASDEDGQHYVFELQAMEGGGYGPV